jgi:hypothetical protein
MVITRSHINEQISKGGKKMANKELPTIKPKKKIVGHRGRSQQYVKDPKIDTGFKKPVRKKIGPYWHKKPLVSKRQEEIRKAHEKVSKERKMLKVKPPKKKGDTTDTTKKSIEDKFGDKQPDLKTIPPRKDKPKKIEVGGQTIIFGSKEMKEKAFPKRVKRKAGGGDVVMQKVRKYNEGGTVVHDQSTIKNL